MGMVIGGPSGTLDEFYLTLRLSSDFLQLIMLYISFQMLFNSEEIASSLLLIFMFHDICYYIESLLSMLTVT